MPLVRLLTSLFLLAQLSHVAAQSLPASGTAGAAGPDFVGLPSGGGLDAARVIEKRYGDAPAGKGQEMPGAARTRHAVQIPHALATLVVEAAGGDGEVPVSFGQVFAPGRLKGKGTLQGVLADGATVPLQVDVKARHPDGSVRHAIISMLLERPAAGQALAVGLVEAKEAAAGKPDGTLDRSLAAFLRNGADARVQVTLGSKVYSAAAVDLLARTKPALWLDGPFVREWLVAAPLTDSDGRAHPHLTARFALRWFPALRKTRVDLTMENNWAFAPAPQNFTYDVRVSIGGAEAYAKDGLTHYHHARWRKLFWTGDADDVHVRHDTRQLIDSFALPNYDQSVRIDESSLARLYARWKKSGADPMSVGLAQPAMPAPGGRPEIGLLPSWAVMYLLSMDRRAADMTLGTAQLAGSWSVHYRDQRSGLPVSLLDYPYMTLLGQAGSTRNPATGKSEGFPPCPNREACRTPYRPDIPHQPAFSYLPYLLTGDHYHLEELQFWAMYDVFASNPDYREHRKGLLKPEQVRGQAWALRTLGEAAYITPDEHPLKRHFLQILDSNLDWYNANYTDNPQANALGVIVNGYALGYANKRGLAPWMDDFFTSAVGHLAELGFVKARKLLTWKAKYPVSRMTGDGVCWLRGSMYTMIVRDSATAPFYKTIGEAYRASTPLELQDLPCAGPEMAAALKLRVGEMPGYSSGNSGFPSNMQPALAYAADALGEPGKKAWQQFMARSVKPNYGTGPQFAIVPR